MNGMVKSKADWAVVPGVGWIQLPLTGLGSSEADPGVRVSAPGVTCNLALRLSQARNQEKKDVGHPAE